MKSSQLSGNGELANALDAFRPTGKVSAFDGRKQVVQPHSQNAGEPAKFFVPNAVCLAFDLGNDIPANIQAT